MTQKNNRGGSRPGTGRPKKEPTTTISFRVKKKDKKYIREKYPKGLNTMFNEWFERLLYS